MTKIDPFEPPEAYPIPSFPTLVVKDLDEATKWYVRVLRFDPIFQMPGPDGVPILTHLRREKYADMMLIAGDPGPNPGTGVLINHTLGEETSLDEIKARVDESGQGSADGPHEQPWNVTELRVTDIDGYSLLFSKPKELGKDFRTVVHEVDRGLRESAEENG